MGYPHDGKKHVILAVSHHKAWLIVGLGASFKTLRQTHYIELYIICVYIDGCWSLKECGYPWLYIFFFWFRIMSTPYWLWFCNPGWSMDQSVQQKMDTRQCDKRLAKRRWVVVKRRSRCDGVSFELQIHICVSGWWYQIFFHVSGGNPLVVVDDAGSLLIYLGYSVFL